MDVASSLLCSHTPFNPLIMCSCFMLCLTVRSLGETTGALPVDEEGMGRGKTLPHLPIQPGKTRDAVRLFVCGMWRYQGTALGPSGQGSRACKSNSPSGGDTCGKEDVATEGVERLFHPWVQSPVSLSLPCEMEPRSCKANMREQEGPQGLPATAALQTIPLQHCQLGEESGCCQDSEPSPVPLASLPSCRLALG